MNLAVHIERIAKQNPSRAAVCLGNSVISNYAQLAENVSRLAGGLRNLGCAPGDRVAIISKNTPEYIETLYAIWHAGLIAVPVNAKLHAKEIAFILEDVGARSCFFSKDLATTINGVLDTVQCVAFEFGSSEHQSLLAAEPVPILGRDLSDIAWIFYTSGTTGRPKGAMLSNRNLLAMSACCLLDVDAEGPWGTLLHAAPMSHGSGLYAIPYVMKGGTHVIPESRGFNEAEIYSLIQRWPNISFFAAPTMLNRLVEHQSDTDLNNLKTITYGGAPMHVEDSIRALDKFGLKLSQLYGQGESPMTITALGPRLHGGRHDPRWRDRLGSVGLPQSLVQVRVVDEDDRPLPPGVAGEVLVKGDTVMDGYWNKPETSKEVLRGGWLHTGDIGVFDDEGFLTLKDRNKDLIISGGHNIYPREVEEVLLQHECVAEVAVVGRQHELWGESVEACIVTRSGKPIPQGELDSFCLANIARFKRPRSYRFLEALPKNNYGKVLKRELKDIS